MRLVSILALIFVFVVRAMGDIVPPSVALTASINAYEKLCQNRGLQYSDSVISSGTIDIGGRPGIYYFNFYSGGYVLLSADYRAFPMLGYSFDTHFGGYEGMKNLESLIAFYSEQIGSIRNSNPEAGRRNSDAWHYLQGSGGYNFMKGDSLGPLLSTKWGQSCRYNNYCPVDSSGPCNRVVTGCVATAMAQIMKYHNFPPRGSGKHNYTSTYGPLSAGFDTTYYDWSSMPAALTSSSTQSEIHAVSLLMSHCGIAVNMQYSPSGSGAYSYDAMNAMIHYFNYSDSMQYLPKDHYADSVWKQMLKKELDSGRVIYCDGFGTGGHAYVCDGYHNDYFHFNWGWNGSHDGYFFVDSLNPGNYNFSNYQSAILGIYPKSFQACTFQSILSNPQGSFSDGSSYGSYGAYNDCSWLISPTDGINIELNFYSFNLGQGDTLKVYDGSSDSYPIIGSFTGDSLPPPIISSEPNLYISFTSDSANHGDGFSASWIANYCRGFTQLTSASDTFYDGSGSFLYNNNTSCGWLIQPAGADYVELNFIEFNTEAGYDFVKVYDGIDNTAKLIANLSGNTLPPPVKSSGNSMFVEFISDGGVVDLGWKAVYHSCKKIPELLPADTAFCFGDSLQLIATVNQGQFLWVHNNQILNISDSILFVKAPGTYQVMWQHGMCLADTSTKLEIYMNHLPSIMLGRDTIICENHELTISISPAYSSYIWNNGHNTNVLYLPPYSMAPGTFIISVLVTDSSGCTNSDSISLTVSACAGVEMHKNNEIKVFPNPAGDHVTIEFKNGFGTSGFRLFDMKGKQYNANHSREGNSIRIELSGLSEGSYLISFESGESAIINVKR